MIKTPMVYLFWCSMMFYGSMIHKYIQFLCISDRFLFPFHGALPKKKLLRTSLGKRHSWRPRQRCTMPKPKRTRPWDSNDSICAACGAISLPMLQTATDYISYSHVFLAEIWEVTYHLHVWHGISWHLVFSQPQRWPRDCCLTLYVDLGLMDVDGGEGRERRREWRW
jgi:hypothetical protein